MANPATLFRFRITVSDVDRGFYGDLDFRAAKHPSESDEYFVTRILAYALNFQDGLTFTAGLCSGDEPAIGVASSQGGMSLWIDIGAPSARKIHKAAKAATSVRIYTHKDPENIRREAVGESMYKPERVEIFALTSPFLKSLIKVLERDNHWNLMHTDGELIVTAGDATCMGVITPHRL